MRRAGVLFVLFLLGTPVQSGPPKKGTAGKKLPVKKPTARELPTVKEPIIAVLPAAVEKTPLVRIPATTYTRCPLSRIPSDQETADVPEFYMEIDEVTQEQYRACVKAKHCRPPRVRWPHPDQPVTGVSWYDADNYCRWIGRRLPHFVEWKRTLWPPDPRRRVDQPDSVEQLTSPSQYCSALVISGIEDLRCGYRQPAIVLSLREDFDEDELEEITRRYGNIVPHESAALDYANYEDGIRDLMGNVAEWVADWTHNDDRNSPDGKWLTHKVGKEKTNPYATKMALGASYAVGSVPGECGSTRFLEPTERRRDVGFRCASDTTERSK